MWHNSSTMKTNSSLIYYHVDITFEMHQRGSRFAKSNRMHIIWMDNVYCVGVHIKNETMPAPRSTSAT